MAIVLDYSGSHHRLARVRQLEEGSSVILAQGSRGSRFANLQNVVPVLPRLDQRSTAPLTTPCVQLASVLREKSLEPENE